MAKKNRLVPPEVVDLATRRFLQELATSINVEELTITKATDTGDIQKIIDNQNAIIDKINLILRNI